MSEPRRKFCAYFWFVGWGSLSLGFHVSLTDPNMELHVPFGFFRIGWVRHYPPVGYTTVATERRLFGWDAT